MVSDSYLDLTNGDVDVAIRWGKVGDEGMYLEPLFHGAAIPVCSPSYLDNTKSLVEPADLLDQRLIQLEGVYRSDAKWPSWFKRFGVGDGQPVDRVSVDSYTNMIQAALAGQGIALGDMPLLDDLIADGRLVCPLDIEPVQQDYFYLVLAQDNRNAENSDLFCNWIRGEVSVLAS